MGPHIHTRGNIPILLHISPVFVVCADEKLTAFLELEATVARFAAKLPLTGGPDFLQTQRH